MSLALVSSLMTNFGLLNVAATWCLLRTDHYERVQKRNLILVWLVPLLGLIIVLALIKAQSAQVVHKSEVGNDPAVSDAQAIDYALASDD